MRTRAFSSLLALSILGLAGCTTPGPRPSAAPGVVVSSITVTSHSFGANGSIPIDHTCDGKELSPQLTWSSPPEGTKSLAVVVEDPDASRTNFTHWLVFNLPAELTQIGEGADLAAVHGTIGTNDSPDTRYLGPCPPRGEMHRYVFRVFALNAQLPLHEGATRAAVDAAMSGHVLGEGLLIAKFGH